MLSELFNHLAPEFSIYSFSRGLQETPPYVKDIQVDFSTNESWEEIQSHLSEDLALVVIWVHSPYHQHLRPFLKKLDAAGVKCVQLFGTSTSPEAIQPEETSKLYHKYKTVQLGSLNGRWLSNSEIVEGVKTSIKTNSSIIIGKL